MTTATERGPEPVLDHVAHAVPRWQDVWERYAVDLGARWSSGGPGSGFAPAQLAFGNGARVELLMPNAVDENDFLARFLAHSGPGPHHLTFKVPDLAEAIGRARGRGFEPIGIDTSDPDWKEAFIHPKQATGVVVQMAQADAPWLNPPPDDFPSARRTRHDGSGPVDPAELIKVVHAVSDLSPSSTARSLFVDLLGGRITAAGSDAGLDWIDVEWDSPLGLRLVSPVPGPQGRPLDQWLAGRPGRVHHLELAVEQPAGIEDTTEVDGAWEIAPEDNAGLRLRLHRIERVGPAR